MLKNVEGKMMRNDEALKKGGQLVAPPPFSPLGKS